MIARRALVSGLLAALAPAALPGPAGSAHADPLARLLACLPDRGAARRLGGHLAAALSPGADRASLVAESPGADRASLVADLLRRHPEVAAALREPSDGAVEAAVAAAANADLVAGRTRLADGWVLAQTEAELCTLVWMN